MPTFEIPDGPTSIDALRAGNSRNPAPAEGSATYSVTNTSSDSVVGRLGVKVSGASKEEWFTIDGDRERTFDPGETQTATVKVQFPPAVGQGDYPFRLRAVAVNDPDNDHVEGPMTTAKLGPGGSAPPSRLWLWIVLGIVALIAVGGGLYYALGRDRGETKVVQATAAKPAAPTEMDQAQALKLAEKKAIVWLDAYNGRDVDTLVNMSEPPFMIERLPLLLSKVQVRARLSTLLAPDRPPPNVLFDRFTPQLISETKVLQSPFGAQLLQLLKLKSDDIAVVGETDTETWIFLFRRSPNDVELAGVVG